MGNLVSPFLSPFAFGFLVARTTSVRHSRNACIQANLTYFSWRWAYGIGSLYGLVVVLLIAFLMEETYVTDYFTFDCF